MDEGPAPRSGGGLWDPWVIAEDSSRASAPLATLLLGFSAGVVSAAILARTTSWLVRDLIDGEGTGAVLEDVDGAMRALLPATAGIVVGCLLVGFRRGIARLGAWGLAAVALIGIGVAAASIIGMNSYPTTTTAEVIAIDPATHETVWRTDTPATGLWGLRTQTERTIVIEGIDDTRCRDRRIAITIERTTGRVLAVATLRPLTLSQARLAALQEALPQGFVLKQGGASPYSCSN